eukprot:3504552-Amphidinium_carterae.1
MVVNERCRDDMARTIKQEPSKGANCIQKAESYAFETCSLDKETQKGKHELAKLCVKLLVELPYLSPKPCTALEFVNRSMDSIDGRSFGCERSRSHKHCVTSSRSISGAKFITTRKRNLKTTA